MRAILCTDAREQTKIENAQLLEDQDPMASHLPVPKERRVHASSSVDGTLSIRWEHLRAEAEPGYQFVVDAANLLPQTLEPAELVAQAVRNASTIAVRLHLSFSVEFVFADTGGTPVTGVSVAIRKDRALQSAS